MKRLMLSGLLVLFAALNGTQAQCPGDRYSYTIFIDHQLTTDVIFGSNLDFKGEEVVLLMDVYEPHGDPVRERPLLVVAHGGTFISGSKSNPAVVRLATDFCRMGYVVASINYRLGFEGLQEGHLDSIYATEAVIRSTQDMRTAIRFFKRDYTEWGNSFGVDTGRIFVGGVSAGAITALHTAFLDREEEIPSYVDTGKVGLQGGLEGLGGHSTYSSQGIKGVFNISGALRDTSWITENSPAVISIHGDRDTVVPYGSDTIWLLNLVPIVKVHGSASVHAQAARMGLAECLFIMPGRNHVSTWDSLSFTDTTESVIRSFLAHQICERSYSCDYDGSIDPKWVAGTPVSVHPNPFRDAFRIHSPIALSRIQVFDLKGRLVVNRADPGAHIQRFRTDISLMGMPPGLYVLHIHLVDGQQVRSKLLKQ